MRKSLTIAALTLAATLAACGKSSTEPTTGASDAATAAATAAAAASEAAATMPTGTFEVTDAAGKPVLTSTINADGTYADDFPDGHRVAGIAKVVDGKLCFDPSGKEPTECFTSSPVAADGSFTATDEKGVVLTIKPKAK